MHPDDRNEKLASPVRASFSSPTSRNSEKPKRGRTTSGVSKLLLSDRLSDSLNSSVLLSGKVPSLQMPLPPVASSSSLICVSDGKSACRDKLQPPPAAQSTRNQAPTFLSLFCLSHNLLCSIMKVKHSIDSSTIKTQIWCSFRINHFFICLNN